MLIVQHRFQDSEGFNGDGMYDKTKKLSDNYDAAIIMYKIRYI